MSADNGSSFTGVRRNRKTRFGVKFGDSASRVVITVGGIGTIVAVLAICLYLVYMVAPLFMAGDIDREGASNTWVEAGTVDAIPRRAVVDDYRQLVWVARNDGVIDAFRISNGARLGRLDLSPHAKVRSMDFSIDGTTATIASEDGRLRVVSARFVTEIFNRYEAPDDLGKMGDDEVRELAGESPGLATVTPKGQIRIQRLVIEARDPIDLGVESPVALIGQVRTTDGPVVAMIHDDRSATLVRIREKKSILTGKVKVSLDKQDFPIAIPADRGLPMRVLVNLQGSMAFLVWADGFCQRYNIRDFPEPRLVETLDFLEDDSESVSTVNWLLGGNTILVGQNDGDIDAWFAARFENGEGRSDDGYSMVPSHHLPGHDSPVVSIESSSRSRMFAAGHQDGYVELYHVTAENQVASTRLDGGVPALAVAIAPKNDALLAFGPERYQTYGIDAHHPDVSLSALFLPVHYEGYAEPVHLYQSSAGTDDAEPKLGLMPLIFGTFKATLYSMLFAVPIAIFAAIYTSEFLNPKLKARIKPVVELMASLPSVILGFLAGILFAPYVEKVLPAMLAQVFTIPLALLMGAYIWQLLPNRYAITWGGIRIWLMIPLVALGCALGFPFGNHVLEPLLFAGDVKRWLSDADFGTVIGGWMLVMLPVAILIVVMLASRVVTPWLKDVGSNWSKSQMAAADLVKFVVMGAVALGITALFASLGSLVGDTRGAVPHEPGGIFGTYISRNALVVGFAMGFAIIPIIYTIAEDALSSVPEHLRGASLGAGATPWQTATRVIVPTAMSGLFSAIMVGLGRGVGETMIVLMAAGNTPIMDWNIFNGFRTLSANIAVELPEAVKDSTHFRVLFLCALVLFILTFILNTVAEKVRQRFRKKAFQL